MRFHYGQGKRDCPCFGLLVTFGAMWRRSVIAIWRIDLVAGAGSERVASVLYPMGYEARRLVDIGLPGDFR